MPIDGRANGSVLAPLKDKPWSAPAGNVNSLFASTSNETAAASRGWDTTFPLEGAKHPTAMKKKEYNPLQDKFLKFHKPARSIAAEERLRKQREMYQKIMDSSGKDGSLSLVDFDQQVLLQQSKRNKNDQDEDTNPEEIALRARKRLYLLWDELQVPEDHREHIISVAFQDTTADSIALMHDEIQRLVNLRTAEKDLAEAIEVREGFVYLLQELVERIEGAQHINKQAKPLVTNLRKASFSVIEKTKAWRQYLGYDSCYLWRGVSYLCKMATDLNFLAVVPQLQKSVGCAVVGNPMLDPSKTLPTKPTVTVAPGAGMKSVPSRAKMLPPIQQNRANTQAASITLAFPPEKFEEAEVMIRGEFDLYTQFMQTKQMHSFNPIDASEPDPVVMRAVGECRFTPDEFDEYMYQEDLGVGVLSAEAQKEITNVIKIQKLFRGVIDRRRARKLRERHNAAMKLQLMYRCWAAKQELKLRRARHAAASKIQALARGGHTREANEVMGYLHEKAAKIQALWRGHHDRKVVEVIRAIHWQATRIQKVFRGFVSRKKTKAFKAKKYAAAAAEIQKIWKGGRVRTGGSYDPKQLRAAVTIQSWFRKCVAIRFVAALKDINRAATKMQAVVRGGYARKIARGKRAEKEALDAADEEA